MNPVLVSKIYEQPCAATVGSAKIVAPYWMGRSVTGHLVDHPAGFIVSPSQLYVVCHVMTCLVGRVVVSHMCLLQARDVGIRSVLYRL